MSSERGCPDDRRSRGVLEQSLEHLRVEAMAALDRAVGTEDRMAGQAEIAHGIQHLVPDEFERVAQAFAVHHVIVADGDGVGEVRAESRDRPSRGSSTSLMKPNVRRGPVRCGIRGAFISKARR